mmetsp:Transcript_36724/g.59543  ORF Transcript_36724/g.59543 Transcript_36724/m.59543 type:complete len:178 (-) Transcript_36724:208-741(-)
MRLRRRRATTATTTTTTLKGEPASLNDEKGEDGKTTGNKSMMQQGHSSHFDSAIKLLECRLAETRKVNLKNKANVAISQSKLADMLMARGRIEEEGGGGGVGLPVIFALSSFRCLLKEDNAEPGGLPLPPPRAGFPLSSSPLPLASPFSSSTTPKTKSPVAVTTAAATMLHAIGSLN